MPERGKTTEVAAPAQSKTTRMLRGVTRLPLFRQLLPLGAGIGWPIPIHRGTALAMLPVFGRGTPEADRGTPVYAPLATLTLQWATGRVVHYRDLHRVPLFKRPQEPIGWSQRRGAVDDPELMKHEEQLGFGYDSLFDALAAGRMPEQEVIAEISRLLPELLEPGLKPYYEKLAPRFSARFLRYGTQ